MMTMDQIESQRHAEERGKILQVLVDTYVNEMTSVSGVLRCMDLLGYALSSEALAFHLRYLTNSGYIRVWRTRDMPGWRADRPSKGSPDEPRFATLLPKGLQLADGHGDADPMVRF